MTSATIPAATRNIGIAGTTIAHGVLVIAIVLAARRGAGALQTVYEVNLVAAPQVSSGPRVVQTAPAPKKPVAPPVRQPVAKPAPKTRPPAVQAKAADPVPAVKAPPVLAPGEKPGEGHDAVTIHQEGVTFPFPEYLANIQNAIFRRWNHSGFRPGLEAKIAFVISKDGSIAPASYDVVKSSGNSIFDENARAAIESAVANHEFGPLPAAFNGPSLSILFVFTQVRPGQG